MTVGLTVRRRYRRHDPAKLERGTREPRTRGVFEWFERLAKQLTDDHAENAHRTVFVLPRA